MGIKVCIMKTIANLENYWVLLIFAYEYLYAHGVVPLSTPKYSKPCAIDSSRAANEFQKKSRRKTHSNKKVRAFLFVCQKSPNLSPESEQIHGYPVMASWSHSTIPVI